MLGLVFHTTLGLAVDYQIEPPDALAVDFQIEPPDALTVDYQMEPPDALAVDYQTEPPDALTVDYQIEAPDARSRFIQRFSGSKSKTSYLCLCLVKILERI